MDQLLQLLGALFSELVQLPDPVQPVLDGVCGRRVHFTGSVWGTAAGLLSQLMRRSMTYERGGQTQSMLVVDVQHVGKRKYQPDMIDAGQAN